MTTPHVPPPRWTWDDFTPGRVRVGSPGDGETGSEPTNDDDKD